MDSTGIVDELTYNMEDSLLELDAASSAEDLLLDTQNRHKIFHDDFVIKTSYETKKAHRGQVRANGDPYLKHCVEAAVLLAFIRANSSVDVAGLLHDTLDDSFVTYEHIFQMFCAGVADLVEGYIKMKWDVSDYQENKPEGTKFCEMLEEQKFQKKVDFFDMIFSCYVLVI